MLSARFPGEDDAAAVRRTVRAALLAEEVGFDEVWLAEHHFMSYGVVPSAITLAGHLLGRTRRIAVGTAVSVLSATHPVALAEQAALLALASDGRLRLGVGRGGPWRELEVLGTGLRRYEEGFGESLDLLLAWLRADRLGWSGDHFSFREVPVVPRAAQPPPVAVACTSPATETLAASRGLPMLLGMHVGDAEKAAAIRRHDAVLNEHGTSADPHGYGPAHGSGAPGSAYDPGPDRGRVGRGLEGARGHVSVHLAQVGASREAAEELLAREMPQWLGPALEGYVPVDGRARSPRDALDYVRELCSMHPVGSTAECAVRIEATVAATGVRNLIFLVEGAGSEEATLANIRRLGAEVLPRVTLRGST